MVKFTFWPNSISGLLVETMVLADTYEHARHKIMKELYLHKEHIDNVSVIEEINHWE